MAGYDVFVSYRRKDTERVLPLVEALRSRDLAIWLDQREIGDFAPITDEIRNGLAASKALLAWYSKDYPQSRPCQMELTAAFVAARRDGDPRHRVLVVNSEPDAVHVEPVELRDDTSIAAWNLFGTLRETEDAAAGRVLKSDLLWLLERDPSTLLADQRKIRDMLRDVLKK